MQAHDALELLTTQLVSIAYIHCSVLRAVRPAERMERSANIVRLVQDRMHCPDSPFECALAGVHTSHVLPSTCRSLAVKTKSRGIMACNHTNAVAPQTNLAVHKVCATRETIRRLV